MNGDYWPRPSRNDWSARKMRCLRVPFKTIGAVSQLYKIDFHAFMKIAKSNQISSSLVKKRLARVLWCFWKGVRPPSRLFLPSVSGLVLRFHLMLAINLQYLKGNNIFNAMRNMHFLHSGTVLITTSSPLYLNPALWKNFFKFLARCRNKLQSH